MMFKSQKPHFHRLRQKWLSRRRQSEERLFDKHLRRMAAGSLGGLMLLTQTGLGSLGGGAGGRPQLANVQGETNKSVLLANKLKAKLPNAVRPLHSEEEADLAKELSSAYGFKVSAALEGRRLNRSYGLIGGEQHLYRYPGDNVQAHARDSGDWVMFGGAGVAPGLGAWGYFAPSKQAFSAEDEERERWYIAVPTFLSPGFAERVGEYRDFYKYRKMLLVNPKTGQAVVADIGDAGPAEWTGKHLGGSPEVMHELGLASGPRKGEVLYFFLEDEASTPLGPIKPVNVEDLAGEEVNEV